MYTLSVHFIQHTHTHLLYITASESPLENINICVLSLSALTHKRHQLKLQIIPRTHTPHTSDLASGPNSTLEIIVSSAPGQKSRRIINKTYRRAEDLSDVSGSHTHTVQCSFDSLTHTHTHADTAAPPAGTVQKGHLLHTHSQGVDGLI